ncbi:hypothetical protein FJY68_05070 [candidate division WOR-3 bacterium]|uniref:Uncharacterized protein n=1 Tax=candidate division WOR-3 bacterium TaxID=2052148 RepID=A0A937XHL0_UNCW3|nr:hypothetical protein [candidate division WOR-3 bacterium]
MLSRANDDDAVKATLRGDGGMRREQTDESERRMRVSGVDGSQVLCETARRRYERTAPIGVRQRTGYPTCSRLIAALVAVALCCPALSMAGGAGPYFICKWCDRTVYTQDARFIATRSETDAVVQTWYGRLGVSIPSTSTFYEYLCPHCNTANVLSELELFKSKADESEKGCIEGCGNWIWAMLVLSLVALLIGAASGGS